MSFSTQRLRGCCKNSIIKQFGSLGIGGASALMRACTYDMPAHSPRQEGVYERKLWIVSWNTVVWRMLFCLQNIRISVPYWNGQNEDLFMTIIDWSGMCYFERSYIFSIAFYTTGLLDWWKQNSLQWWNFLTSCKQLCCAKWYAIKVLLSSKDWSLSGYSDTNILQAE